MGMYDSFMMKAKCPYCGNEEIFEFQTKSLINSLITWKQGQRFDKFKKRIRKYAWCPDIKEGIIYDCIAGCNFKKCRAWAKKKIGYDSGFGRSFCGDIIIKKGIVKSVKVRKERVTVKK